MIWLNVIGGVMVCIGFPTALIDMGMNGTRYASWTPWGVGMALIGLVLVQL